MYGKIFLLRQILFHSIVQLVQLYIKYLIVIYCLLMERLKIPILLLIIIYMILTKRSLFKREVIRNWSIFKEIIKVIEIIDILIRYIWDLMEVN